MRGKLKKINDSPKIECCVPCKSNLGWLEAFPTFSKNFRLVGTFFIKSEEEEEKINLERGDSHLVPADPIKISVTSIFPSVSGSGIGSRSKNRNRHRTFSVQLKKINREVVIEETKWSNSFLKTFFSTCSQTALFLLQSAIDGAVGIFAYHLMPRCWDSNPGHISWVAPDWDLWRTV